MNVKEYLILCTKEFLKKYGGIPESFSWSPNNKKYHENIERIKKYISIPKNQGSLGVCWAITFASAMNDAFLIKEITTWNPNISTTYILSKFPYIGNCLKGSIIKLGNISINNDQGFASESCIDYSWCEGDKKCSKLGHKNNLIKEYNVKTPTEGCYFNDSKKYSYKLSGIYYIAWNNFYLYEGDRIKTMENFIKIHIIIRSPVIFAFPVFKNFEEKFWKKNKGIYIEETTSEPINFHSMCVVGWGKDENIPYWILRNSWGTDWGESGYCKIAGYPYNKWCCPENITKYPNDINKSPYVVFLDVKDSPELIKYNKAEFKDKNFLLTRPKEYYKLDEDKLVKTSLYKNNFNGINCFEISNNKENKCIEYSKI
jgi:hypothetical protein